MTFGLAKSCAVKSELFKASKETKSVEAKNKYVIYRNRLQKLLNKAEKDFYRKRLAECHGDQKGSWKVINAILNKGNRITNACNEFKSGDEVITDGKAISNKFNNYFVNIGKTLAEKIQPSKTTFLEYMNNPTNANSCGFELTTKYEIIKITKGLKNCDSSGFDEIPTSIVKSTIDFIAEPLAAIINSSISSGNFPDKMKVAKVCPVYKAGDKGEFTNYRPISILTTFSKIFEKIIAIRLTSFIDKNNIFSNSQFGFRKNHSAYMSLMKLYDKITQAIDNNEYCIGIFIDLSKAFDTLNHDILLKKLEFYGIRDLPNLLLKSYLMNRKQYVLFNNITSTRECINCGVPQGSILGPLLFLIYVNDMPNICRKLLFMLFADDTSILYSNSDIMQLMNTINSELINLSDWFKANRLSLNIQKTSFIMFGYKKVPAIYNSHDFNLCIRIDNENISRVDYTKFLGVIIDNKLTWQRHVDYIALKISKSLSVLSRLKYKLPKSCLLTLYYCLVYPQLNYCTIIWGCASKTLINKLLLLQKRAVRIIDTVSYWKCHTDPIFIKYNLLKIMDIYLLSCLIFLYKFKFKLLPEVCSTMLTQNVNTNIPYSFRHVHNFDIPSYRTSLREKCIKIRGPKYWDSISDDIKNADSLSMFKSRLRNMITDKYRLT